MIYVHIDCNSYFASCEVATNPRLEGKPVVVANPTEAGGGVILALNNEAKALGLKRGIPIFKAKQTLEANEVTVCQADHKKYKAISKRIMQCVIEQGIVLDFVQYSIDEFFGCLPVDDPEQIRESVKKVKDLIYSTTHIPVGCGCAQTYTLAKVATYFAKHYAGYDGICIITEAQRLRALALLPLKDVWGIGRRYCAKLNSIGLKTALDFINTPSSVLSGILSEAGMQTWRELQGQVSIRMERSERRKSIMQSRTFGFMISSKEQLSAEISRFASDCCYTLREQKSLCSSVTIFIQTNRYRNDLPQYANSAVRKLESPTSDTPTITSTVLSMLNEIFRNGYQYKRAGVVLGNITADEGRQLALFDDYNSEKRVRLMNVADEINRKFGSNALILASSTYKQKTAHKHSDGSAKEK